MRKLIMYIAQSLDGYVADAQGGVGFLQGQDPLNEDPGTYDEFISGIDTVFLGYNTYHQIKNELSKEVWPYEGKQSYVFTHRHCENKEGIIFTPKTPKLLLEELRQTEGKDIWLCGGAALVNQLRGQIDEYRISVIPCILGGGIPLFTPQDEVQNLQLVGTAQTNGIVELQYVPRKDGEEAAP